MFILTNKPRFCLLTWVSSLMISIIISEIILIRDEFAVSFLRCIL